MTSTWVEMREDARRLLAEIAAGTTKRPHTAAEVAELEAEVRRYDALIEAGQTDDA